MYNNETPYSALQYLIPRDFLKTIWKAYKGFTGLQLSTKTHMDNTPWKKLMTQKCTTELLLMK